VSRGSYDATQAALAAKREPPGEPLSSPITTAATNPGA
jgi:hypothetical protein